MKCDVHIIGELLAPVSSRTSRKGVGASPNGLTIVVIISDVSAVTVSAWISEISNRAFLLLKFRSRLLTRTISCRLHLGLGRPQNMLPVHRRLCHSLNFVSISERSVDELQVVN